MFHLQTKKTQKNLMNLTGLDFDRIQTCPTSYIHDASCTVIQLAMASPTAYTMNLNQPVPRSSQHLKEKSAFPHIKSHNKDIYNHI